MSANRIRSAVRHYRANLADLRRAEALEAAQRLAVIRAHDAEIARLQAVDAALRMRTEWLPEQVAAQMPASLVIAVLGGEGR